MGVKDTQFNTKDGWDSKYTSGKYVSYHTEQLAPSAVSYGPSGSSGDPMGHTASGGVIADWVDPSPGAVYRTHTFNASGEFTITALSPTYPAHVEYLVVGGGGGGGGSDISSGGGGGGAAGIRSSLPEGPGGPSPTSESSYPVGTNP